jgi:hypothetical protein
MRLLVYGGTGYYERQRIGAWENVPRDGMDDSFRLEEERLSFGLCLIEREPVLVIRQLQVTKTGRAYPYSLLLDPGTDVWHGFGWNAAALAHSLFDEATEMSRRLLKQPETLNAQVLQEVFENFDLKEDRSFTDSTNKELTDAEATWIGAFFTPSLSSLPPSAFGFEALPNLAEISNLLWHLPPCFRAGLGWLIGGSGQSGRNFGAQFAIDDKADAEATTDELVSRGREIHEALQTFSNDDDFADTSERLRRNPVWEWANDADKNSGVIAQRLATVAALLRPTNEREALLQRAFESLPQTGFLEIELRKAWHRAAFSGGKKLTPEQTSFVMQNHFNFNLPLRESEMALLDEDRLAESFIREGLDPSSANVLRLPLAARHKVWLTLLLRTREHEDIPGMFFKAVEDIEEENPSGPYVESFLQAISERMMKDRSFSLLHWRRYAKHPLWPSIKKMLRDVALDRAQAGSRGWEFEYLLFAADDGARELLRIGIIKGELLRMIKLFAEAVRSRHEDADAARKWLQALADSEIRTMGVLGYEDKLLIAMTVGGSWRSYADLWAAYSNQSESFEPGRAPTMEERDILLKELDELIQKMPVRNFVPDLGGLETMLGSLPPKTVSYFHNLSPTFSKPEDARKWVSALGARDSNRASKETVRYFLESDDPAFSDYWLTPEFEEKEMESLFTTLLFRPHPLRDKRYQRRLRELLTKAQGNKRVIKVVRHVFKEGIEKEADAKTFCNRFSSDRIGLEALLRCLHKTTTGIALTDALARYDADHFIGDAREVWQTVNHRKDALTPYQYSFIFNLSKRKGTRLKVERSLEDLLGGPVELRLDEILRRGVEAGAFHDQPDEREDFVEEVKETKHQSEVYSEEYESGSLLAKVKNYFGFGVAKKAQESSRENSSGERNEIFPGLPADPTVAQEDEDLPDEPNLRDL